MTKVFRCKGCGETNSIVEVSLVPRIVGVSPDGDGGLDYDSRGNDEYDWEAETVLQYACSNESCRFWQGQYGIGPFDAMDALPGIAEEVDE